MNVSSAQVTTFLAFLTIVGQGVVGLIVVSVFLKKVRFLEKYAKLYLHFIARYATQLSFAVATSAMGGSLYFSDIAGYSPCTLCWWQRIFMYPQVVLFGVAMIRKEKYIIPYSLTMVAIGALISLFHYFEQVTYNPLVPCSTIGYSVSCTDRFFTTFGYVTIPLMAATAFVMIASFLLVGKAATSKK